MANVFSKLCAALAPGAARGANCSAATRSTSSLVARRWSRRRSQDRPEERLSLEPLEPRVLLAVISWTGAAGDNLWHTPANWDSGVVPTEVDDAVIDVAGTPTILFNTATGEQKVRTLLTREAINFSGGSLEVAVVAVVDGAAITLSGGTLLGGHWSLGAQPAVVTGSNSVLDGVSLDGQVRLPSLSTRLWVRNGLTMTPTSTITVVSQNSGLRSLNTQTFNGGTIIFNGASGGRIEVASNTVLTLGPDITVRGYNVDIGRGFDPGLTTVINQGTLISENAGVSVGMRIINSLSSNPIVFHNTGLLQVNNNGRITIDSATGDAAGRQFILGGRLQALGGTLEVITVSPASYSITAVIEVSGGTFQVTGDANWQYAATAVTVTGGTMSLGAVISGLSSLGAWTRTGGTVNIRGAVQNAGQVLALGQDTGSWVLDGGSINGGTIHFVDGQRLDVSSSTNNRMVGVTVQGNWLIDRAGAYLRIADGLSFTGTWTVSPPTGTARLVAENTQEWSGGTIVLDAVGASASAQVVVGLNVAGVQLTLTPETVIRGGRGTIGAASGLAGLLLENRGEISADAAGRVFTIFAPIENHGIVQAVDGAELNLSSAVTNSGIIRGVTGLIRVRGLINNAGRTLTLDADTGSWRLTGGSIAGGTLRLNDGQQLIVDANTNNRLIGVAVEGDWLLDQPGFQLRIAEGLTLHGTMTLAPTSGTNAQVIAESSQTWSGGTIRLQGSSAAVEPRIVVGLNASNVTLTVDPTMAIRGGGGLVTGTTWPNPRINLHGTLAADDPTGPLRLFVRSLVTGTVEATGGATLIMWSPVDNLDSGVLTGGTWVVGPQSFINSSIGSVSTNNATVVLEGGGSFNALHSLSRNDGVLRLLGGHQLTVPGQFTNAGELVISPGSVLTAGAFTQTANAALRLQAASPGQFGRIVATGAAAVDGALELAAVAGYAPARGDAMQLISSDSLTGNFAVVTTPSLPPHLKAPVLHTPQGVRLLVTSIADANNDGVVDSTDISSFLTLWLESVLSGGVGGDFDGDGIVNSTDISVFITAWLAAL